jgi:hypothetical protein
MSGSTWTADDLKRLEAAMSEGALRVKYKDKEIEYRSVSEMSKLRDLMKRELGLTARTSRIYPNFSKGLDCE